MDQTTEPQTQELALSLKLKDTILSPMKQTFVGKDEIIDLLGICLVARENLFLLGPPGTAKSALVQDLSRRIEGNIFDYLLTRFTEPNEIFGPFDIRKLREGELITNTEGMLPEATFVFLDELLNANSAILNSLLMVLNERIFRRGRETRALPTLMVVGASNHLPEDSALGALFDRFLVRVRCDNVEPDQLSQVLTAGWKMDVKREQTQGTMSIDEIRSLQNSLAQADFSQVQSDYVALIHRMRKAGIDVSDRRAVKLQRLLAASAILSGRLKVNRTDFWILRSIWHTEEQIEILASLVNDAIDQADETEKQSGHPRSRSADVPDPELLVRDIEQLEQRCDDESLTEIERAQLQDQVTLLASRCQWVESDQQKTFLTEKINKLRERLHSLSD
ncbi:AAA domain-containing protein [Gimesia chilikensis]|uniref:AAA family ATPase n=1 Tax=Gimesia chilikensis TaxID=2605989 RepID=UPI0011EE87B3|nr:AAA family ATPase [Gimesia chilikensis]KAA0143048.1 AAA domain-containing protein [Gimesia chilikensis]